MLVKIDEHNQFSTKDETFEILDQPLNHNVMTISIPQIDVYGNNALIKDRNLVGYVGNFQIKNINRNGTLYKIFSGSGNLELKATQKHLHVLKLNNTGFAIRKEYFYGCLGKFRLVNFESLDEKVVNSGTAILQNVLKKNASVMGTATQFLVNSEQSRSYLSSNFISIVCSGLVVLELPFTEKFLKIENIKQTVCKKMSNVVAFQNTLEVTVLERSNSDPICSLSGKGVIYTEAVSALLSELKS